MRREFLVEFYLASDLTPQVVSQLLASRRGDTEAMSEALRTDYNAADDPKRAWVIHYELTLCKAEIEWLNQMEIQISSQ